jgi:hypothetical protein
VIPTLLLAADLLEHAADPTFGDATNEIAAWRFQDAMSDEGLRSQLLGATLIDSDDDLDKLSFPSWIWLLSWRQREGAALDEQVLDALTLRAASADRRLRLRVLIGRDPRLNAETANIDEYRFGRDLGLPLPWLRSQVNEAASGRVDPYELMRHLLQIATNVTLATLFVLLRTDGDHRDRLRREVRTSLESNALGTERLSLWLDRLGLADRNQ